MTVKNSFRREKVLKEQGLEDWKVKKSKNDGLCQRSIKTIICPLNNQAMFLHEVAHALIPRETDIRMGDKTGHHSIWADKFTALVNKYLKPQPNASNDIPEWVEEKALWLACKFLCSPKGQKTIIKYMKKYEQEQKRL